MLFLLVLIEVILEVRDAIVDEIFGAEIVPAADVAADLAPAGTAHDYHVRISLLCKLPAPVVQVEQPHLPKSFDIGTLVLGD